MEDINIITLLADNGDEVDFEVLDVIEFNHEQYACLLPTKEDSEEIIVLKYTEENNQYLYHSVEDVNILNAVFEEFKVRNADLFDFD